MPREPHTHRCRVCRQPFDCDGEQMRNHDGWPEVVCEAFHVDGLNTCEACEQVIQHDELRTA